MLQSLPLVDRYRPSKIEDLVLPTRHGLHKVLEWFQNPYPSNWLFHGPAGVGKTSLANIMAAAASPNELGRQTFLGPDLDANGVRQLAPVLQHRPVWGGFHAIIINESDSIPTVGQVRMLGMLESRSHAVIIATSNSDLDNYESRLTSRFQPVHFTVEGLLKPATEWLLRIAEKEEISVNRKTAERMVVDSRSNLRAALQKLDAHAARPSNLTPASLPVITGRELRVNRGRTAPEMAR